MRPCASASRETRAAGRVHADPSVRGIPVSAPDPAASSAAGFPQTGLGLPALFWRQRGKTAVPAVVPRHWRKAGAFPAVRGRRCVFPPKPEALTARFARRPPMPQARRTTRPAPQDKMHSIGSQQLLCYAQAVTGDSSGQPDLVPVWKKRTMEGSVFRSSPRGRHSEVPASRRFACDVPWFSR